MNAAARYEHAYPAAVACMTSTLDELTVHLRFPREYWQWIRPTNLLERSFGETRRRTRVIGRFLVNAPASPWSGQSWTGRARAGAG